MIYQDPILTVVILDFSKPLESRICLESVKRHIKIPYKVIFCDNGSNEDYPISFLREGLVDKLIVNKDSSGLGLGTRDLFAASFSNYTLYLQNDQYFARDFIEEDFVGLIKHLWSDKDGKKVASISLAGIPCGDGIYTERGHLIDTRFYGDMEISGLLGYHGAGPYHDGGPWRESQIQSFYKLNNLVHWNPGQFWVMDNGVFAVRDMGESGVFCHRTDTKRVWVIVPPKTRNKVYPKVNDEEFGLMVKDKWLDGNIPEAEKNQSFDCWSHTELGKMEKEYIEDLRNRFIRKRK